MPLPGDGLFLGITSLSYDEARRELIDRLNSVMVGQADITLPKGACGMAVHFLWRADREGNITELTGTVDDAGCF